MRLLIDHDIFMYRALWGCKGNYWQKLQTCDYMIEKVMDRFETSDITLFISGDNNFRKELSSTYKANRGPRPEYLYDAKLYYVKYWGAEISEGIEADDAICMAHDDESIVISTDKDFYQLGGFIYNPVKQELVNIQNPWYFFYLQMLTGDDADNIEGVKNPTKAHHKVPPNFTEKTASEFLAGENQDECRLIVQEMYRHTFGDDYLWKYEMNARLLFLRRANAQEYYEIF